MKVSLSKQEQDFVREFEARVESTINEYSLIGEGDNVLVACSGGKDSTTVLYLLNKLGYNPEALTIDLLMGEYSRENLGNICLFCDGQGIRLHIVSFKEEFGYSLCYLNSLLKSRQNLKSCTVCGILRRVLLNRKARGLKATKLVTGHNLDDEAQTILMNLTQGNISFSAKLGPSVGQVKDRKFVMRVKPLYFCLEDEVRRYSKLMQFPVVYDKCPCSSNSYRSFIKDLLDNLEVDCPGMKRNLVNNFLNILPNLREQYTTGEKVAYCGVCGEPSRNEVCGACNLMRMIH